MGITYIEGRVKGPLGERRIRFLVDSGVTYTVLPEGVWRSIGLKPIREHEFALADGTIIKRKVSECYISLPQGEGHTPVVLGEADDHALLGVVTPRNPRTGLQPVQAYSPAHADVPYVTLKVS